MSEKKFEYDPMHQYVERERTRSMLIEATQGSDITSYFRRVLLLILLCLCGGVYFYFTQTPGGRDIYAQLTKDPSAGKRKSLAEAKKRRAEQYNQQAQQASAVGVDGGKGEIDETEELVRMQKSQEALGHQLEAFSEGKAPPPSPAMVQAAMAGQTAQPVESPIRAMSLTVTPEPAPDSPPARAPASSSPVTVPATLDRLAGTGATEVDPSLYHQVYRVPLSYAQEKNEFPDLH